MAVHAQCAEVKCGSGINKFISP